MKEKEESVWKKEGKGSCGANVDAK